MYAGTNNKENNAYHISYGKDNDLFGFRMYSLLSFILSRFVGSAAQYVRKLSRLAVGRGIKLVQVQLRAQ